MGRANLGPMDRDHLGSMSLQDYSGNDLLRFSVERQLITLGEALNQATRLDSNASESIADIRQIIGLRNILVHGYAEINNELVWKIATTEIISLVEALDRLLEE
jgi:uncharacterized protein with HEPN domain